MLRTPQERVPISIVKRRCVRHSRSQATHRGVMSKKKTASGETLKVGGGQQACLFCLIWHPRALEVFNQNNSSEAYSSTYLCL